MNIKINSLKVDNLVEKNHTKGYTYKDLEFDLENTTSYNSQLNRVEILKDVQALYDVEAVKNSVVNCFMTSPGQKILNPTFGIDLRQYLFEPVDSFTSDIIMDSITVRLPIMEPRIEVENVVVIPDEDNQQYNVSLQINVPTLNVYGLSIKAKLDSNAFTIV